MPDRIGPYAVESRLGRGGMGDVYRGRHTEMGHRVALKVLSSELAGDARMRARFLNEARVVTAIRHPNVVALYETGNADGHVYIAMELLDGDTLAARLRQGARLPATVAIRIGQQIAAALGAAHQANVVHRDLKPQNVMLVGDGEVVKVLDFGIAKILDAAALGGNDGLTKTGSIIGTPIYMSPEQCKNAAGIDHRSDIYSLGCVLYRMLAGRPPFSSGSAGEVIGMHLYVDPQPIAEVASDVPSDVAALIMRCLAKQPDDRPSTMREVIEALVDAEGGATEDPVALAVDDDEGPPTTYDPLPSGSIVADPHASTSPWPRRVIVAVSVLAAAAVAYVGWIASASDTPTSAPTPLSSTVSPDAASAAEPTAAAVIFDAAAAVEMSPDGAAIPAEADARAPAMAEPDRSRRKPKRARSRPDRDHTRRKTDRTRKKTERGPGDQILPALSSGEPGSGEAEDTTPSKQGRTLNPFEKYD